MLAQEQEVETDVCEHLCTFVARWQCAMLTRHDVVGFKQVRKEDQVQINEFGRNNARLHDVRDQKKVVQDRLDALDDANTDLMMGEGVTVQYVLYKTYQDK